MARRHAPISGEDAQSVQAFVREPGPANRVREIGYWGLLILAFALPFDVERQPVLWTPSLSITTLTLLVIAESSLAVTSLSALALQAFRGSPDAATYFRGRRVPLGFLLAYFLSSTLSTVLARSSTQELTWSLGLVTGALLWLVIPFWLASDAVAKVKRLGAAIVAGSVLAAGVGLVEVLEGSAFDQRLLLFKFGPDTMGPILRLSGTLSSANVAAMYFELSLPFAVAGLIAAAAQRPRLWMYFAVWLAAIDLLIAALALTFSRGAVLGLIAAALAMALAARRGWQRGAVLHWAAPTAVAAANFALIFGLLAANTSAVVFLRFSSQTDAVWYRTDYASNVPATMAAGQTRTVTVSVQNQSPVTWDAASLHNYGLGYHWLYPSWRVERFANNVTWLASDLPPGVWRPVETKVEAPAVPGRYLLVWDVIWRSTTWFAPKTGVYRAIPVRVIVPTRAPGTARVIVRPPAPDIATLPSAPALSRGQIWSVALKMIEQRPLFGEGPQGFRMNYTTLVPPHQAARKPPPHAHSLPLEMLVDWGAVGAGLFAALLAALWWPLLRRVAQGQVENSWELAVIGAAAALLGHGMVDYFFNKQSIFVGFWLLCGLAATMSRHLSAGVREGSQQQA